MSKANKLSIYLIKNNISDEKDILKTITYLKYPIANIGNFYTERSISNQPSWLNSFFVNSININFLNVSSAKGILLLSIRYKGKNKLFALTFGNGRYMLKDTAIEERFGLRATLNSVDPSSIRSIEKRNIGAVSKISREQLSKASTTNDFGIDVEQDLIRAVTGDSKIPEMGKIISGADSLSVSVNVDITSIKYFLNVCYRQYLSEEYKKEFDWIDQIKGIKDSGLIDELNIELINRINASDFNKVWLAVPDLIDWEHLKGLRYIPRKSDLSDDIDIVEFADSFKGDLNNIVQIKNRTVTAISAIDDEEIENWSAYKCLYGELEFKGKQYVINNSKWYEIDKDFTRLVNNNYNSIRLSTLSLPDYNHTSEGSYNKEVVESDSNLLLMDKKTISIGGGRNRIEFCDIYTKNKKLIHVKHYGASSVMSHLFMQGLNSGELFFSDSDFRKKLNLKLEVGWKIDNPLLKINSSEYEIVFAIISNQDDNRPNIPFFSKVSLKNAKRKLESYDFKVSLKRIKSLK